MTPELMIGAAFLAGTILGAASMYLQVREIMQTRQEIKEGEIARLKNEVEELKKAAAADPYIPSFEEFMKISDQAVTRAQIASRRNGQEVDFDGNF